MNRSTDRWDPLILLVIVLGCSLSFACCVASVTMHIQCNEKRGVYVDGHCLDVKEIP